MNNRNPTDKNTVKIKYIPYTFAQVPVAELTQLKEMDIEKKHLITLTQITTCRWKVLTVLGSASIISEDNSKSTNTKIYVMHCAI